MKPRWTRDLEDALLRELSRAWHTVNRNSFHGGLKPPSFELSDDDKKVGQWVPARRQIRLARSLIRTHDWLQVVEVLKHEMAHQYVHEVLDIHDESAHGPAFQQVCNQRGIDGTAAGLLPTPEGEEDRIVRRIRRLLALADSPNLNEAEAAAKKAYSLMVEHNVRWVREAQEQRFVVRQLGELKQRFNAHEKVLAGILGSYFFVTPIFVGAYSADRAAKGRVLEISGTLENVQMAEHVHSWLLQTGERVWREYRIQAGLGGNTERRRFLLGMLTGFREHLEEQRRACEETGLVWKGSPALDAFVGTRHPRLRTGRSIRYRATDAWSEGRNQGRGLRLHRPVHADPSKTVKKLTKRD